LYKRIIFTVSVFLIALVLSIGVNLNAGAKETAIKTEKPAPKYTLKDYFGKVAVFKYNSNVPQETLDVYTNSLPEFDQKELAAGVNVYNDDELYSLIEDYDS